MGQQQLLLIVLGVIIVGIAIAVGISMFKSNAQSSNRDQVINDLNNLAAKAQQYYRKPTSMAGGGQSFYLFGVGSGLSATDTVNANGSYYFGPDSTTAASGVRTQITTANEQNLYIYGVGTEAGNSASVAGGKVAAIVHVTQNGVTTSVVN